jgi:hypothetical protein
MPFYQSTKVKLSKVKRLGHGNALACHGKGLGFESHHRIYKKRKKKCTRISIANISMGYFLVCVFFPLLLHFFQVLFPCLVIICLFLSMSLGGGVGFQFSLYVPTTYWFVTIRGFHVCFVNNTESFTGARRYLNRSVALTWVMFQNHRAGKMRTKLFLFLLRLLDTGKSWSLTSRHTLP